MNLWRSCWFLTVLIPCHQFSPQWWKCCHKMGLGKVVVVVSRMKMFFFSVCFSTKCIHADMAGHDEIYLLFLCAEGKNFTQIVTFIWLVDYFVLTMFELYGSSSSEQQKTPTNSRENWINILLVWRNGMATTDDRVRNVYHEIVFEWWDGIVWMCSMEHIINHSLSDL